MSAPPVAIRRESDVLVVTLDRPHAANALNAPLQDALVTALRDAATDASVRAVVIAAAGGRVFSAGADLKEFADLDPMETARRRRELLVRTLLAVIDCPRPVVAAVEGKAVGGGAMLAFAADEVVADPAATFSLPEIKLGRPSPIGVAVVAARTGRGAAHRLVQIGKPAEAVTLASSGLVDLAAADAEHVAIARAASLGALPSEAYAANKAALNAAMRQGVKEGAVAAARWRERGGPVTEGERP